VDIGNQQRVIIVEPENVEMPAEQPMPVASGKGEFEFVGEWPLPIAIEPDPAPVV
jgi:hypothetical protein